MTDASDISSFVESSSRDAPILLMNADGTDTVSIHREDGSQPAKKIKVTRKDHTSKTVKDVSKVRNVKVQHPVALYFLASKTKKLKALQVII